jgi:hypothetical protein
LKTVIKIFLPLTFVALLMIAAPWLNELLMGLVTRFSDTGSPLELQAKQFIDCDLNNEPCTVELEKDLILQFLLTSDNSPAEPLSNDASLVQNPVAYQNSLPAAADGSASRLVARVLRGTPPQQLQLLLAGKDMFMGVINRHFVQQANGEFTVRGFKLPVCSMDAAMVWLLTINIDVENKRFPIEFTLRHVKNIK